MDKPDYLKDISTERQFRLDGRTSPDPNAIDLWNRALTTIQSKEDFGLLNSAFEFAKKIQYRHVGLSSEIYFTHPMRTAAMALLCEERKNIDFGIIGLLHNVFELSDTSPQILSKHFGDSLTSQILALTVDRNFQWDLDYKQAYYDNINSNPLSCRVVKVLDKIDNLFVLGLNPDNTVREKYLSEIKTHILPMAESDLPSVFPYLYDLVNECELTGFLQ